MQGPQRLGTLLAGFAFASVIAMGAALAGGTPNDAAGAQGHNAPSIAAPTEGVSEGNPNAKILPYSSLDQKSDTEEASAAPEEHAK
ncbi:hypothetical protein [Beijerinckia indica]|uniref:Uncharacterized protein n=1 Tax=Beijerinckia indica subsp. indica (strain ATCC 9039 / DSM 1715 / NCIMB 8712) TaxID=395963 RepID=B2IBS9_BEII9|nr:hypothetical protein [Beijerinckia indica]ACB93801.1 hypothetical protein Bind_0143 [Beijerinckia indica subsp. indica ATCC 9039]